MTEITSQLPKILSKLSAFAAHGIHASPTWSDFLRIHFPRFSLSECHDSWLCEAQTDSIEVRGKRKFCKHSCEDKALQLKIFSVWWRSKNLYERNSGRTAKFAAFVKDSSFCSRWNVVNHRNKFSTTPEMRVFLESFPNFSLFLLQKTKQEITFVDIVIRSLRWKKFK